MEAIDVLLRLAAEKAASDIFVTPGRAPALRINGEIIPIGSVPLAPQAAAALVMSVMDAEQRNAFERSRESNFAITGADRQRFRVSAFYQRGMPGMVLRRIETRIPTLAELGLPPVLESLAMTRRGLIMFVGATGMGKSTSLAAMIGHRNRHSRGHIISIEDPIEFLHEHDGCIVTQREVGIDTDSFEIALRNTLRQAPDVIMIGEVRSRETMEHALAFAETGHLCLCTLHANNANQALDRVLQFFPAERHAQVLMDLSLNLRAVVAQQLLPAAEGGGRSAAIEILQNSPLVSDHIRKGEMHLLKALMARSTEEGMQTFDGHLRALYAQGRISYETALAHADSANDLRLMIKLDAAAAAAPQPDSGLALVGEDPLPRRA